MSSADCAGDTVLNFSSSQTKKVAEFEGPIWPFNLKLPALSLVSSLKSPTVRRFTVGTLYEPQTQR